MGSWSNQDFWMNFDCRPFHELEPSTAMWGNMVAAVLFLRLISDIDLKFNED